MKKVIAVCLAFAVASWLIGPALAVGTTIPTSTGVDTELDKGQGGGSAPIVKAKWEMYKVGSKQCGSGTCGEGEDASSASGAQFDAPGTWNGTMDYTVCAIVTDPNGAADIYGVYADIFYPDDRGIHATDPEGDDRTSQSESPNICGAFIEENTLIKKDKEDGYHLFCDVIREDNDNLPVFNQTYYDNLGLWNDRAKMYNEICAADGELMKEEAFVYCDDKSLIWEDPAGFYTVKINALDKSGKTSEILENDFEYVALTKFEVDFSKVDYGEVLLNTHKKISGDRDFEEAGNSANPTVRNLGNTRLIMGVAQDDMGLGQSSGQWNVRYDARVGNYENDWEDYYPFKQKGASGDPASGQYEYVNEILDLSETEEMDFSVLITKWPDDTSIYQGDMWLTGKYTRFRTCISE